MQGQINPWRLAIWILAAVYVALTAWWVQPRPEPVEETIPVTRAIPSTWVEQARTTSPDGLLDAVIAHADPAETRQTVGEEGRPSVQIPVEGDEALEDRLLSVRVVPKGEPLERERPYFWIQSSLFRERVAEKSVLTGYDAPELQATWEGNGALLVHGKVGKVEHKTPEAVVPSAGTPRRVALRYALDATNP